MKQAVDKDKRGLTLVPRRISRYLEIKFADLDYADDIALFEETDVEITKKTEAIREIGNVVSRWATKRQRSCPSGVSNPIVPLGNGGLLQVPRSFL